MADKKLNEVSQLTDFDYALVVKGNDVAKVTKQQLATILGGFLGIKNGWSGTSRFHPILICTTPCAVQR